MDNNDSLQLKRNYYEAIETISAYKAELEVLDRENRKLKSILSKFNKMIRLKRINNDFKGAVNE